MSTAIQETKNGGKLTRQQKELNQLQVTALVGACRLLHQTACLDICVFMKLTGMKIYAWRGRIV